MEKIDVEKNTGNLYSDCFSFLTEKEWNYQGEVLAELICLKADSVENKVCLDAGCGHGALTWQIAEKGAESVYGVDLKPTPKEIKFVGKEGVIKFIQSSILGLPFEDDFFDFIVSTGVLHHTFDTEKAFSELVRVLKPGGKIILGLYGKHGLFPYVLSLFRIFTVRVPLIRKKFIDDLIKSFKFSPMQRYQILDYLYVPVLRRYSPKQVMNLFLINGLKNPERIFGLSSISAKEYRKNGTVYTYDSRTLLSKLLFGYGFIVFSGEKSV